MRGNPVKLQKKRRNGGGENRTRERINKCLLPLGKNHANNTETSHVREKTTLFLLKTQCF